MDDDVIARLRRSKYEQSADEAQRQEAAEHREAMERQAGRAAGKEWAARRASFHELAWLADWRSAQGGGVLSGRPVMPMSPSDLLRSLALNLIPTAPDGGVLIAASPRTRLFAGRRAA